MMGEAKTTRVLLVVPEHGMQQDFTFEHAERLLKMPGNGGWVLPRDSKFEMTGNGLKYRSNPKGNKGKQERRGAE